LLGLASNLWSSCNCFLGSWNNKCVTPCLSPKEFLSFYKEGLILSLCGMCLVLCVYF
jgi:hypothetical protein